MSKEDGHTSASGQLSGAKASELQTMDDAPEEQTSQVYEGVTSESFEEYAGQVVSRLDGLNASAVVLTFALFLCCGILSVSTLIRSFERT